MHAVTDEYHPPKPDGPPLDATEAAQLIGDWSLGPLMGQLGFTAYRTDTHIQVWHGDAMVGRRALDADGHPVGLYESIVHTYDDGGDHR